MIEPKKAAENCSYEHTYELISRKDRKPQIGLRTCFSSCPAMVWSRCGINDRKYWSLTRNTCNRYVEGFKILFEASSQVCSATLTTISRPGLRLGFSMIHDDRVERIWYVWLDIAKRWTIIYICCFLKLSGYIVTDLIQGRRNSRGRHGTFWPISIFIYRKSIEVFYSLMSILI